MYDTVKSWTEIWIPSKDERWDDINPHLGLNSRIKALLTPKTGNVGVDMCLGVANQVSHRTLYFDHFIFSRDAIRVRNLHSYLELASSLSSVVPPFPTHSYFSKPFLPGTCGAYLGPQMNIYSKAEIAKFNLT